jgi:quercetin dioxygenase-like cupin family protein
VTDHENSSLVCAPRRGYLGCLDGPVRDRVRHSVGERRCGHHLAGDGRRVDYITREITIQPGGSTGWHYHDGRVFGVVREGTLTRTMKDCSVVASPEGAAVTEDSGSDHTHIGRNLGPGPLVLWVDYIQPAGTPLAVDVPDPGCG